MAPYSSILVMLALSIPMVAGSSPIGMYLEPSAYGTVCECAMCELLLHVKPKDRPAIFVVNCDLIELPGSHWVVIFF